MCTVVSNNIFAVTKFTVSYITEVHLVSRDHANYALVHIVCMHCLVRDRERTKMERDILADVNHPFIVKLNYGMLIYFLVF